MSDSVLLGPEGGGGVAGDDMATSISGQIMQRQVLQAKLWQLCKFGVTPKSGFYV
jgi:hypothetical protein